MAIARRGEKFVFGFAYANVRNVSIFHSRKNLQELGFPVVYLSP